MRFYLALVGSNYNSIRNPGQEINPGHKAIHVIPGQPRISLPPGNWQPWLDATRAKCNLRVFVECSIAVTWARS